MRIYKHKPALGHDFPSRRYQVSIARHSTAQDHGQASIFHALNSLVWSQGLQGWLPFPPLVVSNVRLEENIGQLKFYAKNQNKSLSESN